MSMPSAIVERGATAVRLTCTGPVALTVNGNAALPSWLKPPENDSVMVAGAAGGVGVDAVGDVQATAPPATMNTMATRIKDEKRAGDDAIEVVIRLVGRRESKPLASFVAATARGFKRRVTSLPHSVLQQIIANLRIETPCSHEMTHRRVLIEGNKRERQALALLFAAPDAQRVQTCRVPLREPWPHRHDPSRGYGVGVAGRRRFRSMSN